ncbi:uncharacterized protein RSE6_13036 [Rhynchosporium secalis]|uniref:P-loop containing nucleoside triphosphate hydrolase protein n=1 Tax=Rhynchosporium secalis TaxID=38038 RepID=A0A1E1MRX3_RHYSE|nr:uncharacterized protein RSE6_13036 [Rhynchosporium secalis]
MSISPHPSLPSSNPGMDLHLGPDPALYGHSVDTKTGYPIPSPVLEAINEMQKQGKGIVVMTCGIAGSGKSTLARNLETQHNFTRLSIDAYILQNHGTFSVDYPSENLEQLQDEAEGFVKGEMERLLRHGNQLRAFRECGNGVEEGGGVGIGGDYGDEGEGEHGSKRMRDVVLDLSFYCRGDRDFYREMVERVGGGRWETVLIVFKPRGGKKEMEGVLWERILGRERELAERERGEKEGGREGMPVSRELLSFFLRGFEWPVGEGEIVIDVV